MGNSQSSEQVGLEDFKEQVFSQVVFFISKYANHQLEFKPESECDSDYLPQLKNRDYEAIINYYQGGSGELDYHIENYLTEHVLNSQENVTRFHKILMAKLSQDPDDLVEEDLSDNNIDLVSVASNVQQFIKSYEEAPGVGNSRAPTEISRVPTEVSKVPTEISKVPTKISRAPTEVSKVPTEISRVPTEVSRVPDIMPEIESVSSSKFGFTRTNDSPQFTHFEIPDSEYPESVRTQPISTSNLVEELKAAKMSKEVTPVEENVEEAPVEETAEEASVEETAEEAPVEEAAEVTVQESSEMLNESQTVVEQEFRNVAGPEPAAEPVPETKAEENAEVEIPVENLSDEELSECLVSRV